MLWQKRSMKTAPPPGSFMGEPRLKNQVMANAAQVMTLRPFTSKDVSQYLEIVDGQYPLFPAIVGVGEHWSAAIGESILWKTYVEGPGPYAVSSEYFTVVVKGEFEGLFEEWEVYDSWISTSNAFR